MSPVSRATAGGRAYLDLQRMARRTNRPTDELLRTHVLDRFLWRVANSSHADRLVLKGGLLLAAFGERRPTGDVDLLARGQMVDEDAVSAMVAEVLAVGCDDGVDYAVDRMEASAIREEDRYPGVRVVVPATIDRARSILRVDVNVGDPVVPAPVTVRYPGLLHEPFDLLGYPFETVLAEKVVTMLDRGALNTRERDFADVHLLSRRFAVDGSTLVRAFTATMDHRGTHRRSIADAVGDLGRLRQSEWRSHLATAGLTDDVPVDFEAVIGAIVAFAQPALDGEAIGKGWDPLAASWLPC